MEKQTQLVVLPQEVSVLAERVATEKREEVNNILNQLFSGTESWKQQISNIKVKDHTDTMAMQMADTARLNVKKARLEAEKLFDSKREEVQKIKAEFDLEDKLWLKSKQIMQELFKSIEQEAEYKANTLKRYEVEQKEKRTQERLEKIIKYNPTISRFDIENLSEEMFTTLLNGVEKEYNDRIESEKKAEEERIAKEKAEAEERERIRLENERLRKEAEEKEKQLAAERAKAEAERKAIEEKAAKERAIAEEKARKEREEAAHKLQAEQEAARIAQQKAEAEKAKLQAEIQAKKDAEIAEQKRLQQIEIEKQKEAEKLAKAPIKKQLDVWVNSFSIPQNPIENNEVSKQIVEKFESFKKWSLQQINNL